MQDILTALKYLADQHVSTIEINASGKAAWWAAYAAAVAPPDVKIKLNFSAQTLAPAEETFVTDFKVPGVLRAGGLDTVQRTVEGLES